MKIFAALNVCLIVAVGSSFSVQSFTISQRGIQLNGSIMRQGTSIFSSPSDEDKVDSAVTTSSETSTVAPTKKSSEPEGTTYPIDLPSPILLATSMVLAIIGTGSIFDLGGGSPSLGFGPTAAIVAVTIPICLFLFYASILKATAETEADDKEFLKGKKY